MERTTSRDSGQLRQPQAPAAPRHLKFGAYDMGAFDTSEHGQRLNASYTPPAGVEWPASVITDELRRMALETGCNNQI